MRLVAILITAGVVLAAAGVAGAQAPTQDSVTGSTRSPFS